MPCFSVHGSHIGDKGLDVLGHALALHPNIVSLDIGDCDVNDRAMDWIIRLLRTNGAKRGDHSQFISCILSQYNPLQRQCLAVD